MSKKPKAPDALAEGPGLFASGQRPVQSAGEGPEPEKTPGKKAAPKKDKPHYAGHRERLRSRFLAGGEAAVQDYELLELVLFRAIPRRDVKPLAKDLIERFGSFADVIAAPRPLLEQVPGLGEAVITEFKIVQAAAQKLLQGGVMGREAVSSFSKLVEYCTASMAFEPTERFRILFLDRKNQIIADEVQQKGTVDHTPVYPREVVKRALELSASALILVHNHPSGDPSPSKADIAMTKEIVRAARAMGLTVHDHLIVGRGRHYSFRDRGHL